MASEAVRRILEDALPSLEYLVSVRLLSPAELTSITKTRTRLELALFSRSAAPAATKAAFYRLIQYEISLDRLRRTRSRLLHMKNITNEHFHFVQRTTFTFERLVRKFQFDLSCWLSYASYLRSIRAYKALDKVYGRALMLHSSNASLWLEAVRYAVLCKQSMATARKLYLRALEVLKGSPEDEKKVWIAYAQFEHAHKNTSVLQVISAHLLQQYPNDVDAIVAVVKIGGLELDSWLPSAPRRLAFDVLHQLHEYGLLLEHFAPQPTKRVPTKKSNRSAKQVSEEVDPEETRKRIEMLSAAQVALLIRVVQRYSPSNGDEESQSDDERKASMVSAMLLAYPVAQYDEELALLEAEAIGSVRPAVCESVKSAAVWSIALFGCSIAERERRLLDESSAIEYLSAVKATQGRKAFDAAVLRVRHRGLHLTERFDTFVSMTTAFLPSN
jgi:hypothetical protein